MRITYSEIEIFNNDDIDLNSYLTSQYVWKCYFYIYCKILTTFVYANYKSTKKYSDGISFIDNILAGVSSLADLLREYLDVHHKNHWSLLFKIDS